MRPLLVAVVCAAALAAGARPAEACLCGRMQLCEAAGRATAVFIGEVTSDREVQPQWFETTFSVEEALRGALGSSVSIYTHRDGMTSCDHAFPAGVRLLVYAYGPLASLRATCTRTRPVADAAEDLAFLRMLKQLPGGLVAGTVTVAGDGRTGAAPRAKALVRARGTTYAARTDADGAYRLEVPPGSYRLEVEDPGLTVESARPKHGAVTVAGQGSCVRADFTEIWNKGARGRSPAPGGRRAAPAPPANP